LLVAITFLCQGQTSAQPRLGDPVYEFGEALKADTAANKEARDFREKTLKEKAAKLTYLGDIAQVLLLKDWVPVVDDSVRDDLAEKLTKGIKEIWSAKDPDPTLQAGAAVLIRETAIKARNAQHAAGIDVRNRLRPRANDLIDLIKATKYDSVCEAAISALGQIEPEPVDPATQELTKQLTKSKNPAVPRAAARALADLFQATVVADKAAKEGAEAQTARARLIRTGAAVVRAASEGLMNSTDVEVRRWCAGACRAVTAKAAVEATVNPLGSRKLPPEGRPWTPDEIRTVEEARADVKKKQDDLAPLLKAMQGAVPTLTQVAGQDPEVGIRIDSRRALEDIAVARQRLAGLKASLPVNKFGTTPPEGRRNADGPDAPAAFAPSVPARDAAIPVSRPVALEQQAMADDPLGESLRKTVAALAEALEPGTPGPADRVAAVQAKLAALDALEAIGPDAEPALPSLIRALSDDDRFVRWSAARVIGKLATVDAKGMAVPKLAELAADPDLDVRIAALVALERYGPVAKDAVNPYLRKAAKTGDGEVRIAAMRTLQAIGADAAPALAAVTRNLSDFYDHTPARANGAEPAHLSGRSLTETNFRVRQAACETLGVVGPLAVKADPRWQTLLNEHVVPVLQKALNDPDDAVRYAASDALLKVRGK
jgi:HEAT repeat protein